MEATEPSHPRSSKGSGVSFHPPAALETPHIPVLRESPWPAGAGGVRRDGTEPLQMGAGPGQSPHSTPCPLGPWAPVCALQCRQPLDLQNFCPASPVPEAWSSRTPRLCQWSGLIWGLCDLPVMGDSPTGPSGGTDLALDPASFQPSGTPPLPCWKARAACPKQEVRALDTDGASTGRGRPSRQAGTHGPQSLGQPRPGVCTHARMHACVCARPTSRGHLANQPRAAPGPPWLGAGVLITQPAPGSRDVAPSVP